MARPTWDFTGLVCDASDSALAGLAGVWFYIFLPYTLLFIFYIWTCICVCIFIHYHPGYFLNLFAFLGIFWCAISLFICSQAPSCGVFTIATVIVYHNIPKFVLFLWCYLVQEGQLIFIMRHCQNKTSQIRLPYVEDG